MWFMASFCYGYSEVLGIYGTKQTESEGVARSRTRFVYYSHKSLATCAITVIYPTSLSFVAIIVNTSVDVQMFTVTSKLFTHNCR